MGKRAAFAVACAAAVAATLSCLPGDHCSPGYDCAEPAPCYPTGGPTHCEGEVSLFSGMACGKSFDSRTDCAANKQVCVSGTGCATACTSDAECPAESYCAPLATTQASSARAVCTRRLDKGADCTQAPNACAAGLVCDASPTGDAGEKRCRVYCGGSDAGSPRCPEGAQIACIGTTAYRCDECGNGTVVERECATAPNGANTCIVGGGQAFCAVSTVRDPRCANVDNYCDGDTIVDCFQGYATARANCAPAHCVEQGARCG